MFRGKIENVKENNLMGRGRREGNRRRGYNWAKERERIRVMESQIRSEGREDVT